ncbi:hypothetical protein CALCODRAFT_11280 [Calocera cornea HHB12733]|uniref:Uncharacterized protein n=1 Tax=Calocera cornea HHB12733 TaxID=1353952 RepID=A0A165J7B3_9BASI|nr:hypothetical protein CALCODRAFT_11280 [Calocera cornea HHB12733]
MNPARRGWVRSNRERMYIKMSESDSRISTVAGVIQHTPSLCPTMAEGPDGFSDSYVTARMLHSPPVSPPPIESPALEDPSFPSGADVMQTLDRSPKRGTTGRGRSVRPPPAYTCLMSVSIGGKNSTSALHGNRTGAG